MSRSDIVERLRKKQAFVRHGYAYDATLGIDQDCIEAAEEIEMLRAQLDAAEEVSRTAQLYVSAMEERLAKSVERLS